MMKSEEAPTCWLTEVQKKERKRERRQASQPVKVKIQHKEQILRQYVHKVFLKILNYLLKEDTMYLKNINSEQPIPRYPDKISRLFRQKGKII